MMVEYSDPMVQKPLLSDYSGKLKTASSSKMVKSADRAPDQITSSVNSVTTKPLKLSPRLLNPESPEYVKEIFDHIKAVSEEHLVEFDQFILDVPRTFNTTHVTIDHLFKNIAPNDANELHSVAFDVESGNQKRLNAAQITMIRKDGNFEVESKRYPDRAHVWKLSKFFAKGEKRLIKKFWYDMAAALKLVMISCKNRLFTTKSFSIGRGVLSCLKALYYFVDLAIGLPYRKKDLTQLSSHMKEKKISFFLEGSEFDPTEIPAWMEYLQYERKRRNPPKKGRSSKKSAEKAIEALKEPACPSQLLLPTPEAVVSVKLLHPIILDFFKNHIKKIYARFCTANEKRFRSFALQKIQEYEKCQVPNEHIVSSVNEDVKAKVIEEFLLEVSDSRQWEIDHESIPSTVLRNVDTSQCFAQGVMSLLSDVIDLQKAAEIVAKVRNQKIQEQNAHMEAAASDLERRHPILMKVGTWKRRTLTSIQSQYETNNHERYHSKTVETLQKEGLYAAAQLCEREQDFQTNHEKETEKEFEKKAPIWESRITLKRRIWLNKNWIITNNCQENGDTCGANYSVEKSIEHNVDRTKPFWRWTSFFVRSWVWTMNVLFCFLLVIPFCTKFSLRALFSPSEFYLPHFDSSTGQVLTKTYHKRRTLCSRLYDLWRHISKYRMKFESGPDTGVLGKACSRPINVFWNYVVKGFFGTLVLSIVFPLICLITSLTSLTLALMTPLVIPLFTFLHSLFMVLIYDFDSPHGKRRILPIFQTYIYIFLCQGILQVVLSFLAATIFFPILSLLTFLFGCFWAISRSCWDKCCLYTVLKPRGRVPATNSWVAVRVQGPGLASHFLYQINPQSALTALKIHLELEMLEAYENYTQKQIEHPGKEFDKFFRQLQQPLFESERNAVKPAIRQQITKRETALKEGLREVMKTRRNKLVKNGLSSGVKKETRMKAGDLQTTLSCATKMIEMLFPYILKHDMLEGEQKEEAQKRHFERSGLKPDDWNMFAQQMLAEVFSPDILTPLEDSDEAFSLDAEMIEFADIFDWLVTSDDDGFGETLDLLRRQKMNASSPSLKYDWPPRHPDEMMLLRNSPSWISWVKALNLEDVVWALGEKIETEMKQKDVDWRKEEEGKEKEEKEEKEVKVEDEEDEGGYSGGTGDRDVKLEIDGIENEEGESVAVSDGKDEGVVESVAKESEMVEEVKDVSEEVQGKGEMEDFREEVEVKEEEREDVSEEVDLEPKVTDEETKKEKREETAGGLKEEDDKKS